MTRPEQRAAKAKAKALKNAQAKAINEKAKKDKAETKAQAKLAKDAQPKKRPGRKAKPRPARFPMFDNSRTPAKSAATSRAASRGAPLRKTSKASSSSDKNAHTLRVGFPDGISRGTGKCGTYNGFNRFQTSISLYYQ